MADDLALLERWRSGDKAAANELIDRHFGSVHRFFRSKVASDIDDLTQRTFLAALEGLERIREGGNFRAYLLGIARNLLFHHYRGKKSQAKLADFLELSADDMGGTPSEVRAERQEQRILLRGLRSIPIDFQICIELHYWEGMAVSDIADVLGVRPGTIKSRLHRARELLRARIDQVAASEDLARSTVDGLDRWASSLKKELSDERED